MPEFRRFVITGVSGGGKSIMLDARAQRGRRTCPDIGRQVVRHGQERGAGPLPRVDPVGFRDHVLERSVTAFKAADKAPLSRP